MDADPAAPGGHVAVFQPRLDVGGVERSLVNLAGALDARGSEVDVVLSEAEGSLLSEVPGTVDVASLDAAEVGGLGLLASVPSLAGYLRRARPDAVLSAKPHANVVALLARRLAGVDARSVPTVHGVLSHQLRDADRKYRATVRLLGWLSPLADEFVAVSGEVKGDAAGTLDADPAAFSVIHNPVVTPRLLEQSRRPVDHPWLTDGGPPVVLGVGRLHPQKDYATLVRAFSRLRAEFDARLVVLGEGRQREELAALVRTLGLEGEVSLRGTVTNPYPYMREASVLAVPSKTEALPFAPIEAMACGCPVAATRCSEGMVGILGDGRYGSLVPVGDPDALAAAIADELRTPTDPDLLRGRASDFSADAIASEYESVLFSGTASERSTSVPESPG